MADDKGRSEDTKPAGESDRRDSGEFTKGSEAAREAGRKGGGQSSGSFEKGSERAKEAGQKGGSK